MTNYISVAIDGPAGSGKSSVAKEVAKIMKYKYINTGLMYRTIAYFANKFNLNSNDGIKIIEKYKSIDVNFNDDENVIYMNNNIIKELRTSKISALAAIIAKDSNVRQFCVQLQRKMSLNNNVVMDGRDIGSVVLPDSKLKIYMWASSEIRATRRIKQNKELGIKENYNDVLKQIEKRDYADMHRQHSPLVQTKDAIRIDTTNMSLKEVVKQITKLIGKIK